MTSPALIALLLVVASAIPCFWLCRALMPLFQRYALARPNARSSHSVPTPQGGGFAVLVVAILATLIGTWRFSLGWPPESLAVLAGTIILMGLGGVDDVKSLPALLRLVIQIAVIGLIVALLPETVRLLPDAVPLMAERLLAGLALVWFINLVNFMDGIDWITGAELIPVWIVALLANIWSGHNELVLVCALLIGSYLGFMPFNRPVARLFLGDVGSLPLGLVTGWLLYRIGAEWGFVSAVLPVLYYLADATITLVRRILNREKIWEAHRSHFYQQATNRGLSVMGIVQRIALTNVVLGALALAAAGQALIPSLFLLIPGIAAVTLLILDLRRDRTGADAPHAS